MRKSVKCLTFLKHCINWERLGLHWSAMCQLHTQCCLQSFQFLWQCKYLVSTSSAAIWKPWFLRNKEVGMGVAIFCLWEVDKCKNRSKCPTYPEALTDENMVCSVGFPWHTYQPPQELPGEDSAELWKCSSSSTDSLWLHFHYSVVFSVFTTSALSFTSIRGPREWTFHCGRREGKKYGNTVFPGAVCKLRAWQTLLVLGLSYTLPKYAFWLSNGQLVE